MNVARTRKLFSCVEIIYLGFKDPKSKHEEILTVLQIVFLHGITNLSEKKMNNFNSHPFYPTSIKEPKFKHEVTLAMLKIVFQQENTNLLENNMNNFNSHNLNLNNFRVMSYDDYLNEMSTLFRSFQSWGC